MTGIVLMYHRVATKPEDPYGLVVRPQNFAEHVEHLQKLNCVVPLSQITAAGTAPRIAVTFDDGYVDNATIAAPMLTGAGLPATFFITSRRLDGRTFWWDRLAACFDRPPADQSGGVDVAIAGRDLWLDMSDERARSLSLRFLHRRLRPLPPADLDDAVGTLVRQLGAPEPPTDARGMSDAQLRELATLPLIDIGAHTRTHPQLAGQTRAIQRDEIAGSVDDLTAILGRRVAAFAYPFGTRRAVGELAPTLVRETTCELACTTEPGPVDAGSDPYLLPRYNVSDQSGTEFAARLAQLAGIPAQRRSVKRRWWR